RVSSLVLFYGSSCTATVTLSLHDALPISLQRARHQEAIKEFITRRVDVIRLPYDRRIVRIPRHSVIVGTTNDDDFLADPTGARRDRKSTRLNSSHVKISYAVFCLKKKNEF